MIVFHLKNFAHKVLALAITFCIASGIIDSVCAQSTLPKGQKTITLIAADGSKLVIGTATFTSKDAATEIDVKVDAPEFGDEFLSMRPFRCLSGTKETWCHLQYPYASKRQITDTDFTDLEYALLFLFKPPGGYGIDAWNGLYFKLALDKDGTLVGTLHETDLNVLAVPPAVGNLRPIPADALTPVAADAHRFTKVVIK